MNYLHDYTLNMWATNDSLDVIVSATKYIHNIELQKQTDVASLMKSDQFVRYGVYIYMYVHISLCVYIYR